MPAIQNKIGQFTANALIRNMIGQPKSSFDIRKMMDSGKVFIINLSKGRIGESNANLLGGMLITKIYLAALSRADVPDRVLKTLPNFYLFVDEFQSFANESFADILSEARKYKLNLTMAHQYIEQMEEEVRAAVFGNVGTMIVFRVGAFDAEVLEKEFAPQFTAEDIVNLGIFQIYLKLMIDGISSAPFSATTLPPIEKPESSSKEKVIEQSRIQFSNRRAEVEKAIDDWMAPIIPVKAPPKSATVKVEDKPKESKTTDVKAAEPKPVTPAPTVVNTAKPTISNPQPTIHVEPVQMHTNTATAPKVADNGHHSHGTGHHVGQHVNHHGDKNHHGHNNNQRPFVHHNVNLPKLKSVSLSSLTNTPKNNNHKDASPARVNELKSALSAILAANPGLTKNGDANMSTDKPKVVSKPIENLKNSEKTQIKSDTKNEVPEDVLRDVLRVE